MQLSTTKKESRLEPHTEAVLQDKPQARDYWKTHFESTLLASWKVKIRLTCYYQIPVLCMLSVIKG